jgi:hypothetical protein
MVGEMGGLLVREGVEMRYLMWIAPWYNAYCLLAFLCPLYVVLCLSFAH